MSIRTWVMIVLESLSWVTQNDDDIKDQDVYRDYSTVAHKQVSTRELTTLGHKYNITVCETSAKDDTIENVSEIFMFLARNFLKSVSVDASASSSTADPSDSKIILLNLEGRKSVKKCCITT